MSLTATTGEGGTGTHCEESMFKVHWVHHGGATRKWMLDFFENSSVFCLVSSSLSPMIEGYYIFIAFCLYTAQQVYKYL